MPYVWKHTNQILFVQELESRGIQVDSIDPESELIECMYKNHREILFDRYSSLHQKPTLIITSDKFLSKHFLEHSNISTPRWALFDSNQTEQILNFINEQIKYPIVIKPNRWSHGDYIYLHIQSDDECIRALENFRAHVWEISPCIIEKYISGKEYRIFITQNNDFACILREPAYIIWDWIHTIEDIILYENSFRQNRNQYALYPIILDKNCISEQWLSEKTILEENQGVYVRYNSNVATWWITTDMTDNMHPHIKDICRKALMSIPWLLYAWIDLITEDITKDPYLAWYSILEINSNPSFSIHHRPKYGKSRNVSGMIADLLFPETKRNTTSKL